MRVCRRLRQCRRRGARQERSLWDRNSIALRVVRSSDFGESHAMMMDMPNGGLSPKIRSVAEKANRVSWSGSLPSRNPRRVLNVFIGRIPPNIYGTVEKDLSRFIDGR